MEISKVIEVLDQEIKDWQEACVSYENTAQEERKEEGCAALETLKDIQRANEKIAALKSAILLIQDYQKLRERINEEKINKVLWKASNDWHNTHAENAEGYIRNLAEKTITYLK